MAASLEARLLAHVQFDTSGWGCWLWDGGCFADGYAETTWRGRPLRAHRAAWMVWRGSIPLGLHVLHRCDTRPCIRPDHLFLGTNADNIADKVRKGRQGRWSPAGEAHGEAKLTDAQVFEIRAIPADVPHRVVAGMYGISISRTSLIRRREAWKHLKEGED